LAIWSPNADDGGANIALRRSEIHFLAQSGRSAGTTGMLRSTVKTGQNHASLTGDELG
jgi:hypothetical protein